MENPTTIDKRDLSRLKVLEGRFRQAQQQRERVQQQVHEANVSVERALGALSSRIEEVADTEGINLETHTIDLETGEIIPREDRP